MIGMMISLILLVQLLMISSYLTRPIIKNEIKTMMMMWKSNNNNDMNNNNMNSKSNNMKQLSTPTSSSMQQSSTSQVNKNSLTFASYVIYKGKGAVSIKIITPTLTPLSQGSRQVTKAGGLFFEFAPSVGQREYDWSRKGTFLLDVTECGTVLSLEKGNNDNSH